MVNKIKEKFYIILFFIFIIAVIFFLVSLVGKLFKKNNTDIDKSKIDIYNIQNTDYNKLSNDLTNKKNSDNNSNEKFEVVKSYSKFYTIQNALENFIGTIIEKKYSQSYKLLSSELKDKYTKEDYLNLIEKYQKNNFPMDNPNKLFVNVNKLYKAIKITEYEEYMTEYNNYMDEKLKIGIRLDTKNKTYEIFYIEF